jgi:tetratricopeptide (TPR) repeat protein
MSNQCKSCGAASAVNSVSSSWKCDFCGSVNYIDGYVEAYLNKIDLSKISSYMRLAKTAYESHNFEEAARKFDSALTEDSNNLEAWAYKGLALSHTINLSNLQMVASEVNECFKVAKSLDSGDDDFFLVANTVAHERVIKELLRSARREIEQGDKSEFAFSHDLELAKRKASRRYANALIALGQCLDTPSENVKQMIKVCELTLLVSNKASAPSDADRVKQARAYLSEVQDKYPDLVVAPIDNGKIITEKDKVGKGTWIVIAIVIATVILANME